MLANKSISLIQNFMGGVSRYIEYKKRREVERIASELTAKPVKYDKIRVIVKKRAGSESESDSEYEEDNITQLRRKKNKTHYNKSKKNHGHSCKKNHSDSDSDSESVYDSESDLSYQIFKLKNKQRYMKKKKSSKKCKKHHVHEHSTHNHTDCSHNHTHCSHNHTHCSHNHTHCSHNHTIDRNDPFYNSQEYYNFLEFKRLQLNEIINPNNSIDNTDLIRTPMELIVPTKSEEQNKLDIIQGQLDNLMSTDVDSLTSIVTIEYFDRVLEILNSIKQNINTEDETIRNRLIMILHLIFSFITTNITNAGLEKNINEITNKYNNLVDKLYPNTKFIQPLSREIKLGLKLEPVYDLYVKRYGLPKGNLFDNSKIMLLKAEMQWM